MCLFTITLVAIDTLEARRERREARKEKAKAETAPVSAEKETSTVAEPVATSEPTPLVIEEPSAEEPLPAPVEEESEDTDEESEEQPDGVWIAKGQTATLEEKYLELSQEEKKWYDEIEHYAASQEGVKHHKTLKHEDYKIGKYRIVKLSIRRGVIVCEFVLMNQDFQSYISTNKEVSIKQAATVMKIDSAEAVEAAKHSIDLAMEVVEREKQLKRERRNERRRQSRAVANAEVGEK